MEEQIQQDLVDMGFSEIRAKKAVFFTGNKGISEALDWLTAHENDPDIDDPNITVRETDLGQSTSDTPKLSLDEVKALIEKRREEKRKLEEQHEIESELKRREMGKQISQTNAERRDAQEKAEALREKRRKELERKELEKLKEQVRLEREERRRQFELKQQKKQGIEIQPEVEKPQVEAPTLDPSNYTECLIQIRFSDGQALKQKFKPTDTIQDVIDFIEKEADMLKVVLRTNAPPQTFDTPEKLQTTLADAGLVPRGLLVAVKK